MKLKIKEKEYSLNWGLGTFGLVEEELDMDIDGVFAEFNKHKVNTSLVYYAILNSERVKNDDDYFTLDFGKSFFSDWLDQQPQEVATEIVKDFYKWSINGKSWGEKLGIDMAKLESDKKEEPKKKKVVNKQ